MRKSARNEAVGAVAPAAWDAATVERRGDFAPAGCAPRIGREVLLLRNPVDA